MFYNICTVKDCGERKKSRDFCNLHYKRWKKYGDPLMTKLLSKYDEDGNKLCATCEQWLDPSEFPPSKERADGILSTCTRCYTLKRYGTDRNGYDVLLKKQKGKCAICKTDDPTNGFSNTTEHFVVDHDHACCGADVRYACGKCIRGLLCGSCNSGLGHFKDSVEVMRKAANYVASSKSFFSR